MVTRGASDVRRSPTADLPVLPDRRRARSRPTAVHEDDAGHRDPRHRAARADPPPAHPAPAHRVRRRADEADGPLLGRLFAVAADLARSEGIADAGYRLVTNVGRWGGQTVDHLHLHLMGGRRSLAAGVRTAGASRVGRARVSRRGRSPVAVAVCARRRPDPSADVPGRHARRRTGRSRRPSPDAGRAGPGPRRAEPHPPRHRRRRTGRPRRRLADGAAGGLPGHPAGRPDRRLHRRLRVPGRDQRRAAAAGDQAAYLASGPGKVQTPLGTRHVIRQVGLDRRLLRVVPEGADGPAAAGHPGGARDARHRDSRSRADRLAAVASDRERASAAAQWRTGSRLILSVWVRGKSSSGHSRQPAIRWFGPSVALAALTAASMRARRRRRRRCASRPVDAAEDDRLDPAGLRLDHDRIADARPCAARSRCPRDTR